MPIKKVFLRPQNWSRPPPPVIKGVWVVTGNFGSSGKMKDRVATILFKIITCMKLLFSNYLGDYSYSFQGSSELIRITVTVSLVFLAECMLQEIIPLRNFSRISSNYSYMI